jgi:hypothetical protein
MRALPNVVAIDSDYGPSPYEFGEIDGEHITEQEWYRKANAHDVAAFIAHEVRNNSGTSFTSVLQGNYDDYSASQVYSTFIAELLRGVEQRDIYVDSTRIAELSNGSYGY